ncbi:MAG: DUF3365 domain-containing protein [Chloroflexia bacterium]|nr:DUF3365 domain-containing protein [Chloroflexia bacterium]
MKIKLRTKLFILLLVPILLCLGIGITVSAIRIKNNGEQAFIEKSQAILTKMEAVRTFIAGQNDIDKEIEVLKQQYPDGNVPKHEHDLLLKKVPIIASWTIGMDNASQDHYNFRIASTNARNSKHEAKPEDLPFLKQFEEEGNKTINYFNKKTNALDVMRPVYLNEREGCLNCHGNPANSPYGNGKDIIGYQMENMKDGDLRGMFIISSDLAPLQKQISSSIWVIILWGLLIASIAGIIGYFIIFN